MRGKEAKLGHFIQHFIGSRPVLSVPVLQIVIRTLWLGQDVKTAVDARRLHHQLRPMHVLLENGTTKGRNPTKYKTVRVIFRASCQGRLLTDWEFCGVKVRDKRAPLVRCSKELKITEHQTWR